MSKSPSQNLNILNVLIDFKPILHRLVILHCDSTFIKFLVDCVYNVVIGNVVIKSESQPKSKFKHYRNIITSLCSKKVSLSSKRKMLATNQGVRLIKDLRDAIKNHFAQNQC